jgi:transcriptional regulator with XRE-family HTH domain
LNYGERLKQLRKSRDLKQSDLADLLGVSSSAIGSYERCERQPTFEMLHKYAGMFNVSIDYILCYSNEKLTTEAYQQLTALDLSATLNKHDITLDGIQLTEADKQRVLDIARVLLFDQIS